MYLCGGFLMIYVTLGVVGRIILESVFAVNLAALRWQMAQFKGLRIVRSDAEEDMLC